MSKAKPSAKARVLCLHGWGCSAEFMKFQLRNFEKIFPEMEFECIDGPVVLPESMVGDPGIIKLSPNKKFYSWKLNIFDEVVSGDDIELNSAMDTLVEYVNKKGPYDGICGFSMGGAIAAYFLQMCQEGKLKDRLKVSPPKFGIFCSSNYKYIGSPLLTTPSIHFSGPRDFLCDASIQLSTIFLNPLVIITGENHKFPKLNEHEIRAIRTYLGPVLGKGNARARPKL